MNRLVKSRCDGFLQKLVADPLCSRLFGQPVSLDTDAALQEYRRICPRPMCLADVKRDMANGKKSLDDWIGDMQLIFDNAIRYNEGTGTAWIAETAQYYRKKLAKFARLVRISSETGYADQVNIAYAKYLDLLSKPPTSAKIESSLVGVEKMGPDFELQSLAILTQKLTKCAQAGQIKRLRELIPSVKPDSKGNISVDMANLAPEEVRRLWEFVREVESRK
jgi:hypothetical protein